MKGIVVNNETSLSPFFSIVLLAYNQKNLIHRSISSVLNQNYQDFELIIVDGGSIDGTAEVIANCAAQNSKIKIIIHKENLSRHISRIDGVKAATGRYILLLDGDDYYAENAFELLQQEINSEPDYDFYEFGYIKQPAKEIIWFDTREDRLAALFDDEHHCQPTLWNKVYNCIPLKRAFDDMEYIHLNHAEDNYESIVIAYHAKKRTQIHEIILNYVVGIGESTIKLNYDKSLFYTESIKKTFDCVSRFVEKNKLYDRCAINKLELKLFHFAYEYCKQLSASEGCYKLLYNLPQFFSSSTFESFFSNRADFFSLMPDAEKYRIGKWNIKNFIFHIIKTYIPKRLKKIATFFKSPK